MKKRYRIKKNDEFQTVFKKGKSVANRQFVLYVLDKPDQEHFRVGFSVGKKIGNAVTRNRVKRLAKQIMFEFTPYLKQDKDYIVIARQPAATMSYEEIKSSLQHVFKRGKLLTQRQND
ncbi:ribonuclease P protein component [Priestia megaterium]|uniref:ribonuclease P protein component n=1 Tax=Priestia megaterium TaxID=1404 RepID=UPI00119DBD9A|nr:ribonuclease P protein component [Priestia megaterium]MCM3019878.1 ribonuclease P protein component [Priestia megaterium]